MTSFDYQQVLERVGGDEELLAEIVEIFLQSAPAVMGQVRQALDAGRHEELVRAAHTLKGSAGNFAAAGVVQAARDLEMAARAAHADRYEELARRLQGELAALMDDLRSLKTEVAG